MELWAAGFNAWNQLCFQGRDGLGGAGKEQEPQDIHRFVTIMRGTDIRRPTGRLSYTLVKRDGVITSAGAVAAASDAELKRLYTTIETAGGQALHLQTELSKVHEIDSFFDTAQIVDHHDDRRPGQGKVAAAYETGFIVLDPQQGIPLTMGDERYSACLGRSTSKTQPATILGPVVDLLDLPDTRIVKVVAGGYAVGALTESGDVYCWGGGPGGPSAVPLSDQPEPVEPPYEKDIEDFALGDLHIIVLARDGTVYTRGSNSNGQLGIGRHVDERLERLDSWAKVDLDLAPGHRVVGVDAGPRASFIITSRRD